MKMNIITHYDLFVGEGGAPYTDLPEIAHIIKEERPY